jgi:IMP dehydrogenase
MPMTNGDTNSTPVSLQRERSIEDYTKAEEILQDQFKAKDGLDVEALLDSAKNGALTYNDFLVLPGYIGTWLALRIGLVKETDQV